MTKIVKLSTAVVEANIHWTYVRLYSDVDGGLYGTGEIADLCATVGKPVAPHMVGSPLAMMASAHWALTLPNFMVCEFHAQDVPFFHELVAGGTDAWFRPGYVSPLNTPGFGVELDEVTGRKYRLPGSKWFDDSNSDRKPSS